VSGAACLLLLLLAVPTVVPALRAAHSVFHCMCGLQASASIGPHLLLQTNNTMHT
jgi:hypothetical protein